MTSERPRRDEIHGKEQFFFDDPTIKLLADVAEEFARPCSLCAPLVGAELERRGRRDGTTLDIDERFGDLAGFLRYDVYRPEWLDAEYGVIVCDPPFFLVSLSQLFDAVRTLSHNNFEQPLVLAFLRRRAAAVTGTFQRFGLQPTGVLAGYRTVRPTQKNEIELFANFESQRFQPA